MCNDGIDTDGDGKIDYPFDPGCDSPSDDDETDPATPPVCANGLDDDSDTKIDFPADFGCTAASGTSEVFCAPEHDVGGKITMRTTTGTTAGKANDLAPTCGAGSHAPDVSWALQLPVPVATLQVDTIGSSFDTILNLRDANCMTAVGCDDDGGGSLTSKINLNNLAAGGYAITVDGFNNLSGAYNLHVFGTVAAGTACNSPLFSGGANAVLTCATGTTCNATTHKCQ
jgi:hypothetical protein